MLKESLRMSWQNIRGNKMRSFLTILGIVIGVSAVITMVTLGNGATLAVQQQIQGLGTNLLQIRGGQRLGPGAAPAPAFKDTDAEAIAQQIGGIAAVAPEARASTTLVADGRNWSSSVIGSSNEWLKTGNWKLAQGREFSPEEERAGASVCIIGATLHRELFGSSPDVLGQQLRVKAFSCNVIGVLDSKGQGAFGNDQDDMVLIPLKTLQRRVTGNNRVNTLLVSMAEDSDPERVKSSLRDLLRELRKLSPTDEDNFNVLDTKQLADTMAGTTKVMTTLLGAVAAVSLLVGGIGIMNIMLVSVTERTREIGIRKALGAKERTILSQFVVEAATTSALGGALGIALGYIVSMGANKVLPMFTSGTTVTVSPSFNSIAVAFGISVGIGVLFGYLPAKRAARLNPIEALRYD